MNKATTATTISTVATTQKAVKKYCLKNGKYKK